MPHALAFRLDYFGAGGSGRVVANHAARAVHQVPCARRDDAPRRVRAVGQLGDRFRSLDARVAAYREARVPDWLAHDIVVRAADCRAITASQIPDVLKEWRTPEHEAFRPRNAWSLFNAFTSVYRETNPHTSLRRGQALHGLFDAVVGLS